jgi:5-(carboxyamino)imidazole ribonucleotide mutase
VALWAGDEEGAKLLDHAAATLERFEVPVLRRLLDPQLRPEQVAAIGRDDEAAGLAVAVVADGAAGRLLGLAAGCLRGPILAVPLETPLARGLDALTGAVSQPAGSPVASLAIGRSGAVNAALLAVAILARQDPALEARWSAFRAEQTAAVLAARLP